MIDGGEEHSEGQDMDIPIERFPKPELKPHQTLYDNVLTETKKKFENWKTKMPDRKFVLIDKNENKFVNKPLSETDSARFHSVIFKSTEDEGLISLLSPAGEEKVMKVSSINFEFLSSKDKAHFGSLENHDFIFINLAVEKELTVPPYVIALGREMEPVIMDNPIRPGSGFKITQDIYKSAVKRELTDTESEKVLEVINSLGAPSEIFFD